ncbi:MAG TPA: aminotransferase class V-fold PLP-dependent enzyme [Clostridiales bacterium]|nr:aminotransferase class V-fold PLP-dependent enzyme [Clostridiales bacterium]
MLRFDSDYMEGAHPEILRRLSEINFEKNTAYGYDRYCETARQKIREACGVAGAEVYFLSGGTQTNAVAINAFLEPYEGVVAAETGHINVHEAGAIEAGGHKILTLPQHGGKIRADELLALLRKFYSDEAREHMVRPGMVYISHPTEYGTLYSAGELRVLRRICDEYGMALYLDGARLGYGLAATGTDVTLPLIAECCDAFYIGGTKVGALFGEALVLPQAGRIKQMFTRIKRQGALLAKGWLLGLQFDTLFTDGLYYRISAHAVRMAEKLERGFCERGYRMFIKTPTNQKFVILEDEVLRGLSRRVGFCFWEKPDEEHTVVRFATSWATKEENVERLLELI